MNKKGQIIPIIAILSIFLVSYAFYVLVILGNAPANWYIGEHSTKWLVQKEVKLKEIDFYYEQGFRNAIFRTIEEISDGGGKRDSLWDENPYPDVINVFKNTLEKDFRIYLDKAEFEAEYGIVLPKDFEIIIDNNKIKLNFKDELILKDKALDEDYLDFSDKTDRTYEDDLITISKKLSYEYDKFSLSVFERMYNEFSKSNECVEKSNNFKNIQCQDNCIGGEASLSYKIPLNRVGFVEPLVRFKIPKKC
ncbi:MAG: hypothetical protein AABW46_00935 [Nanoarchaeota archaeon]